MIFKVLTYNIHKGFNFANHRFVLQQIREQIRSVETDVVFLQEIQGEHSGREKNIDSWPKTAQFEYLADQIWSHYAYGKNAIYNAGHHGNAILSKYPFIQWENINVSSMQRASRSLLHGVIQHPETAFRLHLICVHLDLRGYERRRQLRILNQRIREHVPEHEPLLLAGDFNDWRSRADKYLADDLGLREIFLQLRGAHAKTFPSLWPILPVDRIYYRGITPVLCVCCKEAPWHQLSDHVPLYAEFEIGT